MQNAALHAQRLSHAFFDKTNSCLCRKNEMMQCIDCMFRAIYAVYRLHLYKKNAVYIIYLCYLCN